MKKLVLGIVVVFVLIGCGSDNEKSPSKENTKDYINKVIEQEQKTKEKVLTPKEKEEAAKAKQKTLNLMNDLIEKGKKAKSSFDKQ